VIDSNFIIKGSGQEHFRSYGIKNVYRRIRPFDNIQKLFGYSSFGDRGYFFKNSLPLVIKLQQLARVITVRPIVYAYAGRDNRKDDIRIIGVNTEMRKLGGQRVQIDHNIRRICKSLQEL